MVYIAGLDLAQSVDFTALSILDIQGDPPRVEVAQLLRWRGLAYPAIVEQVADIVHRPPLWGSRRNRRKIYCHPYTPLITYLLIAWSAENG